MNEQGVASAIVSTAQQIGGAIGLAVIMAIISLSLGTGEILEAMQPVDLNQAIRTALIANAEAILYEERPAKELLLRYFHEVIEYTRRRSCFMVNASLELAASHPEVFKRVQANMAENEEAFYQLLERAVQTGEMKGTWDLKALAQYLVNVMHGITVTTVTAEREMLDNIVRSSLYFLP
ncbi:TetR family transcriptional regulator C-terminal domain-containing protein [Brevibacillus brevis]|uniref:TetR family transcriptional regulator C-terminal domain-containing protein n=1 Tax=Brevibacillus brevis TaxID=1393 RepID=UPI00211AB7E7|nr:hypothetical protein [Brevibacillus brevis]